MKKISVIIPVFNSEKHLEKCLNSVINQSYKNIEVIVINDGSTDNSYKIINKIAEEDNRIMIINQKNSGVSSARNSGLDKVTGDYIGFVDSDDYICETMYEQLMTTAIKTEADIVECNFYKVKTSGDLLSSGDLKFDQILGSRECVEKYLKRENTVNYNVNKIYHSKIIKNVRYPKFKYSEDYYFNSMALMNCQKKVTIPNKLYNYVQHPDSASMQSFNEDKLDIIKSGELVLNTVGKVYPELSVYIVMYILNNIRVIYRQLLHKRDIDNKDWKYRLVNKYNIYFDEWKNEIFNANYLRKNRYSLNVFRKSPSLDNLLWSLKSIALKLFNIQ